MIQLVALLLRATLVLFFVRLLMRFVAAVVRAQRITRPQSVSGMSIRARLRSGNSTTSA